MTIDALMDRLFLREGGYVDHPADRGGPTKYGITQATLSAWRGRRVSAEDVQALDRDEAARIYRSVYWDQPGLSTLSGLHPLIVEMLFDASVNHGPTTAVKMLQRAAGAKDDGVIGPKTRAAVHAMPARALAAAFAAERVVEYGRIITKTPSQAAFAHGWARRSAGFIRQLGDMV